MSTMLQAALGGFGIALLPEFLVMHPDVRRSHRVRLVADRVAEISKRETTTNPTVG